MFKWNKSIPVSQGFGIDLYDNEKRVCTFRFSNRIAADNFIVRNNIVI